MGDQKQTVLVGISIGARVASVAFFLPGKKEAIPALVSAWPAADDVKSTVVPICLSPQISSEASPRINWGYSVNPAEKGYQDNFLWKIGEDLGSKLELDLVKVLCQRQGAKKYQSQCGHQTSIKHLSQFLNALKSHFEKRAIVAFGNDIIKTAKYQVSVTVPSWWNTYQRALFQKQLTIDYGSSETQITCEATASLLYYLSKTKSHLLVAGDRYVHCSIEDDATTLSMYIVQEKVPNLRLASQKCEVLTFGSIDFSDLFHEFVEKRLLEYFDGVSHTSESILEEFAKLRTNFVKGLPKIDGIKPYKFRLPWKVPDSVQLAIVDSQMTISGADLRESIFDPLLDEIQHALPDLPPDSQSKIYILLSGVLSECPYTSKGIESSLVRRGLDSNVKLLKSNNGHTSGSRGVALMLDITQNKSSLVALPPNERVKVIATTRSRLATLLQHEESLNGLQSLSDMSTERRLRQILTERKVRAGCTFETGVTFSRLIDLFEKFGNEAKKRALYDEILQFFTAEFEFPHPEAPLLSVIHLLALYSGPHFLNFAKESGLSVNHPVLKISKDFSMWTPIFFAAYIANIPSVDWLLDNGADCTAVSGESQSVLHVVISRHKEIGVILVNEILARILPKISRQPILNLADKQGVTALELCKKNRLAEAEQLIIHYGASENPRVKELNLRAIQAAKSGNLSSIQTLLQESWSLVQYISTPEKDSLVHYAAASGSYPVVLHLINNGGDASLTNAKGDLALHIAVSAGHEQIVSVLVAKHRAGLKAQNSAGDTVLSIATKSGNVAMMRMLIQAGANSSTADGRGWLPIHYAAYNGEDQLVKMLIKAGANVNVLDSQGYSSLHKAVQRGHEKTITVLLKYKADPSIPTLRGRTTLMTAAQHGYTPIVKTLLKFLTRHSFVSDDEGRTCLHDSVAAGHLEIIKMLLKKGHPLNFGTYKEGYRPISIAVLNGQLEAANMLLKNGAEAEILDNEGRTLLHLAVRSTQPMVLIPRFVSAGNINAKDLSQSTPLHEAAMIGNPEVASLLVKHGAHIAVLDSRGRSPLLVSVTTGKLVVSKVLADGEASFLNLNITLLHEAVKLPDKEHLRWLLSKNIQLTQLDDQGRTPLVVAIENKDLPACKILLESEVQSTTYREAFIPLLAAAQTGQEQIARLLLEKLPTSIHLKDVGVGVRRILPNGEEGLVDYANWTPLHHSAWAGDSSITSTLLQYGADVNTSSEDGTTPLILTALAVNKGPGHIEVADTLLSRGANPLLFTNGIGIIHLTAITGDVALLKLLIRKQVDLSTLDKHGDSVLSHAINHGKYDIVVMLLDAGLNLDNAENKKYKGLHMAAAANKLEILKLLITRELDVNYAAENEITPIHVSALTGFDAITRCLLDNKADMTLKTSDGKTALDLAAEANSAAVISVLLDSMGEVEPTTAWSSLNLACTEGARDSARVLYERGGGLKNRGSAVLHWAIKFGLLALLKMIVEFGCDLNVIDSNNQTALHKAAMYGQEDVVSYLLHQGADIDSRDSQGRTAAYHAASLNAHKVLAVLMAGGADLTVQDEDNYTPLHIAISIGNEDSLRLLLLQSLDLKSTTKEGKSAMDLAIENDWIVGIRLLLDKEVDSSFGQNTELHNATSTGNAGRTKILIKHGADVDAIGASGETPIQMAVFNDHIDCVELLLEAGANIEAKSASGFTPLQSAVSLKNLPMLQLLVEFGANLDVAGDEGGNPLLDLSSEGETAMLQVLLDAGARIDVIFRFIGASPLHMAAKNSQFNAAKLLLDFGANVTALTHKLETPLHYASRTGNISLIRLLIDRGAEVESRSDVGEVPLHLAAENGHLTAMLVLLENGANISVVDNGGFGVFHFAATSGNIAIGMYLLGRNQSMEVGSKGKQRPLHLAASSGKAEFTEWILEEGADLHALTEEGSNALHMASSRGHVSVARILIPLGLGVDSLNRSKSTSLHLCVTGSHIELAKYLLSQGADVNTYHGSNRPALLLAAEYCAAPFIKLLISWGAILNIRIGDKKSSALHIAAGSGRPEVIKIFLDGGLDVNDLDADGSTPLMRCVSGATPEEDVARILLDRGAHISQANTAGFTPFLLSGSTGTPAIIKLLARRGAATNAKLADGHTALHIASVAGKADLIEAIVEADPSLLNQVDNIGWSPLHKAVLERHALAVDKLISLGANLRARLSDGCTLLMVAAKNGCVEQLEQLVKAGVSLEAKSNVGNTAIHYAANEGQDRCLSELIRLGARIEVYNENGHTPLTLAAMSGFILTMKIILKKGEYNTNINAPTKTNHSALYFASKHGQASAVKWLLNNGADPDFRNGDFEWTALYEAVIQNNLAAALTLLKAGADPELRSKADSSYLGANVLYYAVAQGWLERVALLLDNGASVNSVTSEGSAPLHIAVFNQDLPLVKLLLLPKYKVEVEASTPTLNTALHIAALKGNIDIADVLIKAGASLTAKNSVDNYPLHEAVYHEHVVMAHYLIEQGTPIDAPGNHRLSALHSAAQNGLLEMAAMLIAKHANLNARAEANFTPLHTAISNKQLGIVSLLVSKGAQLNAVTDKNLTPLHLSVVSGEVRIVEILVQAGCLLSLKADVHDGATPLHICAKLGLLAMAKVICGKGPNFNAKDNHEFTPLMRAVGWNQGAMIDLLAGYMKGELNAASLEGWTALHWAAHNNNAYAVEVLLTAGACRYRVNDAGRTPKQVAEAKRLYWIARLF